MKEQDLIKPSDLARIIHRSRQRIHQLLIAGRFNTVIISGVRFIVKDIRYENFLKQYK